MGIHILFLAVIFIIGILAHRIIKLGYWSDHSIIGSILFLTGFALLLTGLISFIVLFFLLPHNIGWILANIIAGSPILYTLTLTIVFFARGIKKPTSLY